MHIDPWNNQQTRFHRTDPTGRWSPLKTEREAWWVPIIGGFVMGCFIAFGLWCGL